MMTPTNEVKRRFPRGSIISGIVRSHCSFGYYIDIPDIEIPGLVETVGLKPAEKKHLKVGSRIKAVILHFRDSKEPLKRQFRLTIDPIALARAEQSLQERG